MSIQKEKEMKLALNILTALIIGFALGGWYVEYQWRPFAERLENDLRIVSDLNGYHFKLLVETDKNIKQLTADTETATKLAQLYEKSYLQAEAQLDFLKKNPIIKEVYIDRLVYLPATEGEIRTAFETLEMGLTSHYWYILNPQAQSVTSGNTATNLEWVARYELLQRLFEQAYGKRER